jgi:hypothetical protein
MIARTIEIWEVACWFPWVPSLGVGCRTTETTSESNFKLEISRTYDERDAKKACFCCWPAGHGGTLSVLVAIAGRWRPDSGAIADAGALRFAKSPICNYIVNYYK